MRDPLELEAAALAAYLKVKRATPFFVAPLPYDPLIFPEGIQWRIPIATTAIKTDLQDVTNQLNQWLGGLLTWRAWNEVAGRLEESERWLVHWQYVEPVAFHCMFQPSWARDCLGLFATQALHQMAMARDAKRPDRLPWDPSELGKTGRPPLRHAIERHLRVECGSWTGGERFFTALTRIDDEAHRLESFDFRNRSSHGIAPRFLIGVTGMVARSLQQAEQMRECSDGRFEAVPVPGKLAVTYGYGGIPPIDPGQAREVNFRQFERAKESFNALIEFLNLGMSTLR